MRPSVKTLVFITIFFFSLTIIQAQLKQNGTGSVAANVKKVIDDYPNHFENITGEIIIQNPQSTDYQCSFKVYGAEECTITRYSSGKSPISSWQAVMLATEKFEDAKKRFRSLYNELNNLSSGSMHLKGVYEPPLEEKKFATVLFSFSTADETLKRLKVELVMEAQGMEWKVRLLVYDRDRDEVVE
jgi:hypothetical protein